VISAQVDSKSLAQADYKSSISRAFAGHGLAAWRAIGPQKQPRSRAVWLRICRIAELHSVNLMRGVSCGFSGQIGPQNAHSRARICPDVAAAKHPIQGQNWAM
jgi:hypothetical protein